MSAGRVRRAMGMWPGARLLLALASLTYALALGAAPLLHHDLACELKSRTHCTTCVSGVSAPGLAVADEPPLQELPAADPLVAVRGASLLAPSCDASIGRAPPSA